MRGLLWISSLVVFIATPLLGLANPTYSTNGFKSIQVNTDTNGDNIEDDAANETSIAISTVDHDNSVIVFRYYDPSVASDPVDRQQAGVSFTSNGGAGQEKGTQLVLACARSFSSVLLVE